MPTAGEIAELRNRLRSVRDGEALVIQTSGSTDAPKRVALPWSALEAAAAVSAKLIGSGNWVLALPTEYVAGAMVVVRAELSGGTIAPLSGRPFAEVAAELARPKYVSLVPAQLGELLRDADSTRELGEFEAVLVGGQGVPVSVRERAAAAGVRVIVTYGSTETSGGCVYDGRPLPGVQLRVDETDRLWIAGPMLADGYLTATNEPDSERNERTFVELDGVRWVRTDDRARLLKDEQGLRLEILGRADDVLISGGLKLDLAEVQRLLDELLGEHAAIALPLSNARWGQSLGVWRTDGGPLSKPAVDSSTLARILRERFGPAGSAVIADGMERLLTASGKPDRLATIAALHEHAAKLGVLGSMDGDE